MSFLKNIENVDISTFGGRLYSDIYDKYGSINNFCKENNFNLKSIQNYVSNRNSPSIDKIFDFEKLGLDLDFLIKGIKSEKQEENENLEAVINEGFVSLLLIKGTVSAGHGAFSQDKYKYIDYPKSFLKGIRKPAMIDVCGDSMYPIIDDGDSLIFEQVNKAKNGNTIICTYDDTVYVKKYIQTAKTLVLRSINEKYEDIKIDSEHLIIHGVVKKIIKNL